MRKFFGAKVVSAAAAATSSPGGGRRAAAGASARVLLVRPKPAWWPPQTREGLSLRALTDAEAAAKRAAHGWHARAPADERWWTVEYGRKYKGATRAFMRTVASGGAPLPLLPRCGVACEGLMRGVCARTQIRRDSGGSCARCRGMRIRFCSWRRGIATAKVRYHFLFLGCIVHTADDRDAEHSTATDFVERSVFAYERAFAGTSFALTSGTARLDFDRAENRPFFLALHRLIVYVPAPLPLPPSPVPLLLQIVTF